MQWVIVRLMNRQQIELTEDTTMFSKLMLLREIASTRLSVFVLITVLLFAGCTMESPIEVKDGEIVLNSNIYVNDRLVEKVRSANFSMDTIYIEVDYAPKEDSSLFMTITEENIYDGDTITKLNGESEKYITVDGKLYQLVEEIRIFGINAPEYRARSVSQIESLRVLHD